MAAAKGWLNTAFFITAYLFDANLTHPKISAYFCVVL
jgi:hypothetical protein